MCCCCSWEDPKELFPDTKTNGDNDPVDVLELSTKPCAPGLGTALPLPFGIDIVRKDEAVTLAAFHSSSTRHGGGGLGTRGWGRCAYTAYTRDS